MFMPCKGTDFSSVFLSSGRMILTATATTAAANDFGHGGHDGHGDDCGGHGDDCDGHGGDGGDGGHGHDC